jgi:hypothetical protein
MEAMAKALEFPSKLGMVEDFPVETDDSVAIVADDWLVAELQVDYFQSDNTEGKNL